MKMIKKVALAAALALTSSAFAEVTFNAYNKLFSDMTLVEKSTYKIGGYEEDDDSKVFQGVTNRIYAEITTDKVDAMVKADVSIGHQDGSEDDYGLKWNGLVKDWYVEVRPLSFLSLTYHSDIFAEGSYFPIYDDNVAAGNIGSTGFSVVFRPEQVEGLRFGVTLPFTEETTNWVLVDGKTKEGLETTEEKINVGIGAIYDFGLAEIGASVRDVADSDERLLGFYIYSAGLFGYVEGVNLRAGFAHAWDAVGVEDPVWALDGYGSVYGENLWNVAVEVTDVLPVALTLEAAGNTNSEDSLFDLYGAVTVGIGINDQLDLSLTGKIGTDLNSDTDIGSIYAAEAALDFAFTEHDTLGVAVDVGFASGLKVDTDIGTAEVDYLGFYFPVYWKHTF